MTISNTDNKTRVGGNGSVVAFSFSFSILDESELQVSKIDTSVSPEVATLQVITTDYTVAINTDSEGGTVTYIVAPTADEDSFIKRVNTLDQLTDIPRESNFPEESMENALDKLTKIVIQLNETLGRAVLLPEFSLSSSPELPEPDEGKGILWDASGNFVNTSEKLEDLIAAAAASAAAAAASAAAASASAAAAAASAAAASASASTASTKANEADASASAAVISAAAALASEVAAAASAVAALASEVAAELAEINAQTAETNAQTAETNASNSAAAALTSENNASTSETNAFNSASAASVSAANALSSENNAAASAAAAAASAASINTPTLGAGDAQKLLEVNATEDGYDLLVTVRHEQGGLEFDVSGVAKGDVIGGTGAGTMALITASGKSDGDVLTIQADGTIDWEVVAAGGTSLGANVITVATADADHTTIQAAIDAASAGDVILVAPGTYTETITYDLDRLSIVSEGGPNVTTITQVADDIVAFGVTSGCLLEGFTLSVTAASGSGDYLISGANDGTGVGDENVIRNCFMKWVTSDTANAHTLYNLTDGSWVFENCEDDIDFTGASTTDTTFIWGISGTDEVKLIHFTSTLNADSLSGSQSVYGFRNVGVTNILKMFDCKFVWSVSSSGGAYNFLNWASSGDYILEVRNTYIDLTSSGAVISKILSIVGGVVTVNSYNNVYKASNSGGNGQWANIPAGDTLNSAGDIILDGALINSGTVNILETPGLFVVGENDTTLVRVKFNANTAANGTADTFIAFETTDGEIGDISGTADSGVIAYNTFLGSHYTDIVLQAGDILENGMILEMTGNLMGNTRLAQTQICKTVASTKVYGIYGGTKPDEKSIGKGKGVMVPAARKAKFEKAKKDRKWLEKQTDKSIIPSGDEILENKYKINLSLGLGAGYLLVSNTNGNIQVGDLLESAGNGYAQKQAATIIKSSTIGKAVENVNWAGEPDTKKMIGTILYCG